MFVSPSSALVAGLQALIVAALLLTLGYLIADLLLARFGAGPVFCLALSLPGLVAFVFVLMLAHMASGGAVLSNQSLVRSLAIACAVALVLRRLWRRRTGNPAERFERGDILALVGLVAAGVILWGTPVFRMLPAGFSSGDIALHMGWSSQLLNGESTPSAPLTGDIPNFYPWLYHAVAAFAAAFVPGSRAFHSLGALQLMVVTGGILSLYALGRQWGDRVSGVITALFGALSGGVGYFVVGGIDVVLNPRGGGAEIYLGDLLFKRSYNFSFNNLAPVFPRDLAFALLPAVLLLLIAGLRRKSLSLIGAAGVVVGLTGTVGAETFFVAMGAAVLAALVVAEVGRIKAAVTLVLPALFVYSFWLLPIAANYLRLGGFVNITQVGPVTLSPTAVLGSWGIVTPFALWGALACVRWKEVSARVLVATFVSAAAALLAARYFPTLLGEAFLTLGRPHRYWPLMQFAVALLGALGAYDIFVRTRRMPPFAGLVVLAILFASAAPSPLIGSLALPETVKVPSVLSASLRGRPRTFLNVLAPKPGMSCTVAVGGEIDLLTYAYTGYRMVYFTWTAHTRKVDNAARIRWADVYDYIPSDDRRERADRILTWGMGSPAAWERTARAFGVDSVAAPIGRVDSPPFLEHPREQVRGRGAPLAIIHRRPCSG